MATEGKSKRKDTDKKSSSSKSGELSNKARPHKASGEVETLLAGIKVPVPTPTVAQPPVAPTDVSSVLQVNRPVLQESQPVYDGGRLCDSRSGFFDHRSGLQPRYDDSRQMYRRRPRFDYYDECEYYDEYDEDMYMEDEYDDYDELAESVSLEDPVVVSDSDNTNSVNNVLLDDILEGSTKVEDGEPLNAQLASLANDLWLLPHDLKPLYEKHRRPANAANFKRTNLNPEVGSVIKPTMKARDYKLRTLQTAITRAAFPILRLVDGLMDGNDNKKEMVNHAMDSLKTLANANGQVNVIRRDAVMAVIPAKFARLAVKDDRFTDVELLFGKDLSKQINEIKETSSLAAQFSTRPQQFGTTPYTRGRRGAFQQNFRQPHQQQSYTASYHPYRPRGQRGQRRPYGKSHLMNTSNDIYMHDTIKDNNISTDNYSHTGGSITDTVYMDMSHTDSDTDNNTIGLSDYLRLKG